MLKICVNSVTIVLLIIGFTSLSNGKPFDDEDTVAIEPANNNEDNVVRDADEGGIDLSHLGSEAYGYPSNASGEFFTLISFEQYY